ncbi:hypothetical protein KQI61_15390 [Anaerocolumna aminovalerica]|uniref:hypothetical protein n=1 Tax=Anaerocolumna aminovalerica TaxID=1527 RepID=UPI001C0EAED5|nr:hypothetical protein [Anaerocolumna aminovalerica]MBU5333582.1 hypothetical protein [Anaerocolumna aminovalerica]
MGSIIVGLLCIIYCIIKEKREIKKAGSQIDLSKYIQKGETMKEFYKRTGNNKK